MGYTNDLLKRLREHRAKSGKGAKYLRMFRSFELVHSEECKTKSEAMRREAEIKKMTKKEKEEVVNCDIFRIGRRGEKGDEDE